MIYVKRNDGTIEQYEDHLRQALELDKQIQGDSFGNIYTIDSLPEEDQLALGLITVEDIFNRIRDEKYKEISDAFEDAIRSGHFYSDILGIEIDFRRGSIRNDSQNVETLIKYMERNGLTETTFKGYEIQKVTASIAQLKELLNEMGDHGIYLYGKKDALKNAISQCTTKEQIEAIKW